MKKIITISIEEELLELINKDEIKRILGTRSSFIHQIIRKHYGFPSSLNWNYSNEFKKEIKKGIENFIKRIEEKFNGNKN